jgi:hypothetical protein
MKGLILNPPNTSDEGVWALSCSLLENFTPLDEPTPSRLYTIGSSGAEEIFLSSQTRAQLLRHVIKTGRQTIRCLVLPQSSVAPTLDRRFFFFTIGSSDAPLKRGSYLSSPLAAASNSNNNSLGRRAHARTPPSSPPPTILLVYTCLRLLRRPTRARRRPPRRSPASNLVRAQAPTVT